MKKSLLALAVLGAFAGAASAQSSVTLYGTVDLAIERLTHKTGAGASTNDQSMARDRRGTTQISVKGVEDLGGGMSAIFLVENDFEAWNAAHTFANGEAYVGLTGGFGTIKLGTPNEPTLSSQAGRQPFGTKLGGGFSAVAVNVEGAAVSFGSVLGSTGHVRKSKAISYATPNMGGLTGHVYLSGESDARIVDFGVNYAAGPLNLWLTHLNQKATDNKLTTVMGSYDLGVAKVILGFHKEKGTGANQDNKGVNIAATVPLASNLLLKANFAKMDINGTDNDRKIIAFGPEYALSKRTTLYAHYVRFTNDQPAAAATKSLADILVGVQHNF